MEYGDYDALIFDCDGTLVDSLHAHETAWTEVLENHGIPYTPRRMNELGGVPTVQTVEILARDAGIEVDVGAVARDKERRFLALYPGSVTPVEPVAAIAWRHHGARPLAVATGSDAAIVTAMLAAVGLGVLFETVVGSGDVARHKPAPDVYLEAASRLAVDPARCVAFDDADGGLESARRAGMTVVDVRTIWQPANRLFTA
jgi:HAD superfamily hydrolase (TIGR01509 family)